MLIDYLPILIIFLAGAGFAIFNVGISYFLGPSNPDPEKLEIYESGVKPDHDARLKFSVKFYIIAMIFIIFDIEVVFMYPWAMIFKDYLTITNSNFILFEMLVFMAILLVGYYYAWKKGALEWD
ncbi:MAG: NADH-quinone oxidoreductase subunit A [Calditrichaeota bacterium]|nr:MAG: NADH-quinone oxidoreductase subunit A [Calditrichota bacterium]